MVKSIIRIIFYIVVIIVLGSSISPVAAQFLVSRGIIQEEVKISGTGSMYPTFPKGTGENDIVRVQEIVAWPKMRRFPTGLTLFGKPLFSYTIGRQDIVEIDNEATKKITTEKYGEEAGFVKRVIGLSGDTVELRDGYVYINGSILDEPYTAKPRSSYGGDFLPDCRPLTVTEGSVFVLGDNRKASLDSRFELGLVNLSDIHYVIPWDDQDEYRLLWRDTKLDKSLANTATLNVQEFVKLVNDRRRIENLKEYTFSSLLSSSAKRRGYVMIETDDFSTEATRSGVTLSKAVRETGYSNIIFAEFFTRGNFEAQELYDNFIEFADTKKLLNSSQYQDMGVSTVLANLKDCPTEVVVVHLGGYVPPNYTAAEIESWQNLTTKINEVLPSWQQVVNAEGIDQNKLNRLITILTTRRNNAERIVDKMRKREWLNDEEKAMVKNDTALSQEANNIITELNK